MSLEYYMEFPSSESSQPKSYFLYALKLTHNGDRQRGSQTTFGQLALKEVSMCQNLRDRC